MKLSNMACVKCAARITGHVYGAFEIEVNGDVTFSKEKGEGPLCATCVQLAPAFADPLPATTAPPPATADYADRILAMAGDDEPLVGAGAPRLYESQPKRITIPQEMIDAETECGPSGVMAVSPETLKKYPPKTDPLTPEQQAAVSPTPWKVGLGYEQLDPGVYITDAKGLVIYADSDPTSTAATGENLSEANARLIVEAVNACADRLRFYNPRTLRAMTLGDTMTPGGTLPLGGAQLPTCKVCGEPRKSDESRCGRCGAKDVR